MSINGTHTADVDDLQRLVELQALDEVLDAFNTDSIVSYFIEIIKFKNKIIKI